MKILDPEFAPSVENPLPKALQGLSKAYSHVNKELTFSPRDEEQEEK